MSNIKAWVLNQFSKPELVEIIQKCTNEFTVLNYINSLVNMKLNDIDTAKKTCDTADPKGLQQYHKLLKEQEKWERVKENI